MVSIWDKLRNKIADFCVGQGEVIEFNLGLAPAIELGDASSNFAMILARFVRKNPMVIAEEFKNFIGNECPLIAKVIVAAPGFVNLFFRDEVLGQELQHVLEQENFGQSNLGNNQLVNLEYVSVNPTGPMHAGHARGAIVGDVLANLFAFFGYQVTREYYINDDGQQIKNLGKAIFLRYQELLGKEVSEPDYKGAYIKDVAAKILQTQGKDLLKKSEEEAIGWSGDFGVSLFLAKIKQDLVNLGVKHDLFFSERSLAAEQIKETIDLLNAKDLLYQGILANPKGIEIDDWEAKEQLIFKSSLFGDDIDRVLQKSDGTWTYFAKDLVYHLDKIKRGYRILINIWGADHIGYVKRMQSGVRALDSGLQFDIKIAQMVNFYNNGQLLRMSKRAGIFVTLADLLQAVGKDAVRFLMLSRREDTIFDFDYQFAVSQNKDNPLFYIQYAYARICSVANNAAKDLLECNSLDFKPSLLSSLSEREIILFISTWPSVLQKTLITKEVHRIPQYLGDLANLFHKLWNRGKDSDSMRFIIYENKDLTVARLALNKMIARVLKIGLKIIGVEPQERM